MRGSAGPTRSPAGVGRVVPRRATTPAIAKATMREASEIDVTPGSPSSLPRAGVAPRRPSVVPLEQSRELAASLPDARLEVLPGTSASLFLEDPERVADRIAAFASSPTTAPPPRGRAGRARAAAPAPAPEPGGLTPREREVLARSCAGDTNDEIAAALGISVNTVERHASSIYRKLDARAGRPRSPGRSATGSPEAAGRTRACHGNRDRDSAGFRDDGRRRRRRP